MICRHCGSETKHVFIDLGRQPSANRLLAQQDLLQIEHGAEEPVSPLAVYVCGTCFLVQLDEFSPPESLFRSDYVYFSSYSASWMAHAKRYVEMITERLALDENSFVVEIASNDGYLLRNFVEKSIPCLGVDPAGDAAEAARAHGVETAVEFFGTDFAKRLVEERGHADLVIGNNVLAHVPDINGFVAGLAELVGPTGVLTMEFPHFARLLENTQFDTIYDEHYSYLSLVAIQRVFTAQGLEVFDVDELPTHGGSLRVYGRRPAGEKAKVSAAVDDVLNQERKLGLDTLDAYQGFQEKAERIRSDFLALIEAEQAAGNRIAAFGAAAKGNTFLNYCGIGVDSIDFVVDDTPAKQGHFLPGSHIPIVADEVLSEQKPDLVVILPWNFAAEIKQRLRFISEWGGRVATAIPEVIVEAP